MTEQAARKKFVDYAVSYLGCKESDGSHRKIIDLYNSHKPLARGYPVQYNDAWCATYVTAMGIGCDMTDIIPKECGCEKYVELAKKAGIWVENDAYVPESGDIVLYDWDDGSNYASTDNRGNSDHIGIVVSVSGSTIKVIEGNISNAVGYRNLQVNGRYIRGYVVPKFGDTASAPATQPATTVSGTPSTGSKSDEKAIWDFLMDKLGNAYGVAGLMGNLYAESALRSNNLQNSYERSLGFNDETYTAAVDSGSYGNFVRDSAGYGLAQWTYWTRKRDLLNYAKAQKKSVGDLTMQLGFLWKEISEGYKSMLSTLKTAKTVQVASDAVLTQFERPADMGSTVKKNRASYGQKYYDAYAGPGSTPAPTQPTQTELEHKVGDKVQFTGTKHYVSSAASNGKTCKPGVVRITLIAKGAKHPYHVVKEAGGGSTAHGWVDAKDIGVLTSEKTIKKGSRVKVRRGAKTYTGGNLAAFVYLTTYDVIEVNDDRVVIGKGKAVTAAMKASDLILQ